MLDFLNETRDGAAMFQKEDGRTLVNCFEEQVEKFRDRRAVKSDKISLTYGELNMRANSIALHISHLLRNVNKGYSGGSEEESNTVVLLFEHGADMICGMIGVLKAGRIYVPLDYSYPLERLVYMLNDSKAHIIMTNDKCLSLATNLAHSVVKNVSILNIDKVDFSSRPENPDIEIKPENPAYILYTSGSTGRPKGVIQTHKNVAHFIDCFTEIMKIDETDKFALFTSYSHQIGAIDIFGALLNGGAICPYNIKLEGNMAKLSSWIMIEGITVFHSVPTIYKYFIDTVKDKKQLQSMRAVILSGETIYWSYVDLYKEYFPDQCIFMNMFGATEIIIGAINVLGKNAEVIGASVPVGYPLPGVEVVLIDENGGETDTDAPGEITYRSKYLTSGYWNMEELTAKVFEETSDGNEEKLYYSGDLGRFLSDGAIEYLGRNDFQVKIMGNRIEVGEIETMILKHLSVKETAVIAKKDANGNNYLCSFVVSKTKEGILNLRQYLKDFLPDYMIPSYFMSLDKMPLTQNGKIDRLALQSIDIVKDEPKDYIPPSNDLEEKLVEVWKDILDLNFVGVNEDFFDIGGNSILAIKFEVEMGKRGVGLGASHLRDYKTIRQMVLSIENINWADMVNVSNEAIYKQSTQGQEDFSEDIGKKLAQGGRILKNIEPFNDLYYRTCYMNSLIPILEYYNRSIMPFLINDMIIYNYENEDIQNIAQYRPIYPIDKILEEIGIKAVAKVHNPSLTEINSAIEKGRPVVLWIDCYYSPVRMDTYLKKHWPHCILVYGYNDETMEYNVIEHRHKDNLSYEKKVISYQDILNCCNGYMKNFYGKKENMPVFCEYYFVEEGINNRKYCLDDFIGVFSSNLKKKKEELYNGLEALEKYSNDFQRFISCEESLKDKAESLFSGLNNVINMKQVEKYRLERLYGFESNFINIIEEILVNFSEVRKVVAKYTYSSYYSKEEFIYAYGIIKKICELEYDYNNRLFKNI
ncbi:MAG: amino acid adenylation domain-containing protein [Bacillota bacterium]|nr:amino acid adenylation domain-containing protein [Bacillota bacterium]